jgi:hypothetical protein
MTKIVNGGAGMETGSVIALIGAAGTICGVVFGYIGYQRGLKKECKEDGQNSGALMSDIGYIKSGIDDLKRKQETSEARHFALVERVTKVEESAKSAHHRIEGIEERLKK